MKELPMDAYDPRREIAAASGATLVAPRATNAGLPTIFRSAPVAHIEPTHDWTGGQLRMAPTHLGPAAYPQAGPFRANTRLAPTATPPALAAPQLAYSMTGSMGALTEYVQEYASGPADYYVAHQSDDVDQYPADPDADHSPEQPAEPPARKPFLLVGSLAAVFTAVAISILTTTVVMTVTPAADQKPVTSSQQPVLTPLATRVSDPQVVAPASVPVPPPPAPPVIAPAPKPPATPRQVPAGNSTRGPVTQTPPTQAPRSGHAPAGSQHDESDAPPPEDSDGPPPRDRYTPDEGDAPPPRDRNAPDDRDAPRHRDPFTPSGPPQNGGSRFCIPLLPC
jgi:hypothetical protein